MPRSNPRLLRTLAAVSAGALMLGLAACSGGASGGGSAAGGKSTVVWSTWGSADELKRYQDFDKEFMK
ncbi:MAG: hypothetical protein B7X41_16300, partial [Microbacterium sp. 14-71-5]